MSGSFAFTPGGEIVIVNGSRTVLDTAGRLVTLLPPANDYSATVSLVYPDFAKDWAYNWRWTSTNNGGGNYAIANRGDVFITAIPQETSATTILVAAPASCNIIFARVRITRTVAPANTWNGLTIPVRTITGQWITIAGNSVLVESMLAMARAFSLYIDGSGNLVLHQQQSVGAAPGGAYDVGGTVTGGYYGDSAAGGSGTKNGGEWLYNLTAGQPVYAIPDATPSTSGTTHDFPSGSGIVAIPDDRRYTRANARPTTDTTNYASTYSLEIAAKFGLAA